MNYLIITEIAQSSYQNVESSHQISDLTINKQDSTTGKRKSEWAMIFNKRSKVQLCWTRHLERFGDFFYKIFIPFGFTLNEKKNP